MQQTRVRIACGAIAASLAVFGARAIAQPAPDAPPEPPPTDGSGSGSDAGSNGGSAVTPQKLLEQTRAEQASRDAAARDAAAAAAHDVSAPTAGAPAAADEPSAAHERGFRFGSYGRVLAGTDLRGGKPERIAVVAHSPRIVEPSYLELDLSYGFESTNGVRMRPVITLAFDGTLFHDTGDFDAHPALRNMYLEASPAGVPDLTLWAGSRMYRGDDIYLFDYWPLDDLNTVGGGAMYHHDALELAVHGGVNRLNNPFTYQTIEVANPVQGATTVVQLNRQRMIASGSVAYVMAQDPKAISAKAKLYGEVHALPSGQFKRDDGTFEALPADSGFLVGAEVGVWGLAAPELHYKRHLNVFLRYAKGLAAFDELAPPTTFGADLTTQKASEFTFGVSGNWDDAFGNLMIGILSRRFIDATGNTEDPNNGWEYAIDARPLLKLGRGFFAGADVSYQARFPQGLNPITLRAEDPGVFQLAPMVVFSPMGPSAYDRPQLRFVYRAAHLNEGALDLYVPGDQRHAHDWVYFLGVQAEWWWNSSTYKH